MRRPTSRLSLPADYPALIGVNYWSRTGGPLMWRSYDGDVVAEELRQLREHGITHTRSFLYWPDFHPEPDRLDERMLERLDDFVRRHEDAGMQTIPTFIVGHMSGENWDPAWRDGRDIFGDVWFVGRQAWYIREIVERIGTSPAIAGWLLSNEIPIYADWRSRGIGTVDAGEVTAWAQLLIDAIRAGGGTQPTSVGDGAWGREITGTDNGFRVRDLAPLIDFHGPHVYRMEDDVVRQHLGAAFMCELLGIGGLPVIMEEFGLTSDFVDPENAAHYYRQVLHQTLLAGATGWIPWNNVDYDAISAQRPYLHHAFELHFGLVDAEGRPKPQLLEVQRFAELLRSIDFAGLHRPDTASALLVSSFLESDYPFTEPHDGPAVFQIARQAYVAAREADLPIGVAPEADGIPDGLDLIIVPATKALLTTTWAELLRRAEAGATVYASYSTGVHGNQRGAWWPDLDRLFGVRKRLRYGLITPVEGTELAVTFDVAFGGIAAGETLVFAVGGEAEGRVRLPVEADGAEVIARTTDREPILLRRRVGSGAMILATVPFEYFAASTPRVNPEPTARLYAALAAEARVVPEVRVDDPRVLCAVMEHDDGRRFAWFVSESDEALEVEAITTGSLHELGGGAVAPRVRLEPWGVIVRELRA